MKKQRKRNPQTYPASFRRISVTNGNASHFGDVLHPDEISRNIKRGPVNKIKALVLIFLYLLTAGVEAGLAQPYHAFHPGKVWLDDNGVPINAHGGGILYYEGTYYWFGEHKTAGRRGNRAWVGVHCYSSKDLYNWKDEGIALSVVKNDSTSEIAAGCILERPKVIYNKKTKTFVMWFHLELKGQGYRSARTGVAVSKKATGPYKYLRSYRPNAGEWPLHIRPEQKVKKQNPDTMKSWTPQWLKAVADGMFLRRDFRKGQMSRDMTLFVDDDGTAYHIHASEGNGTLDISELTPDYLSFTGRYVRVLPGQFNEAPAMFKHDGKYYLITSGTTGWKPNPARLAVADSIFGPWKKLGNPCIGEDRETTFNSQGTFVLPVHGRKNALIFMADRWNPQNAIDGRYVWLPIQWKEGKPVLRWKNSWGLGVFGKDSE